MEESDQKCPRCGKDLEMCSREFPSFVRFCRFCSKELPLSVRFANALNEAEKEIEEGKPRRPLRGGGPACDRNFHFLFGVVKKLAVATLEFDSKFPQNRFCEFCGIELPDDLPTEFQAEFEKLLSELKENGGTVSDSSWDRLSKLLTMPKGMDPGPTFYRA